MQSNLRRYVLLLAVVITLGIGIAIGVFISHGARAGYTSDALANPHSLAAPSPVELSNSFARIAELIEPAVVNINTETTVRMLARLSVTKKAIKQIIKRFSAFRAESTTFDTSGSKARCN